MDNKQESGIKKKVDCLVKQGLYMGTKETPVVVTRIEVEPTDDVYDEYDNLREAAEYNNNDLDYDRLVTGIEVYVNVIGKYDDGTYNNGVFAVEYPIDEPMQVKTNTETRKKAVKYIIKFLLRGYDFNNLESTKKPTPCTRKFKFWLRQELTKKLKHLK